MFNRLFTNCDIRLVSSYLGYIVAGATCHDVGQEMLTLSGTPDSLWGFHDSTHSLYIHYILLNLSVLGPCVRINDWFVSFPLLAERIAMECVASKQVISTFGNTVLSSPAP